MPKLPSVGLCTLLFGIALGMEARAADPGPAPSWASEAQRRLDAAEYEVTWQPEHGGYQAPNRVQGFRIYFTERGIRAVPRVPAGQGWEWGLQWVGYGRGAESGAVPAPRMAPSKNRVEYRRGSLTEWYENRTDGLAQGFVLAGPPNDTPAGSVHLDFVLTGSLRATIADDGRSIGLVGVDGARVLRYADLRVTDAGGADVGASFEGFSQDGSSGIRLVFDTAGAVYPLTVDAILANPTWTAESNQANAEFGRSVGTAGDVNGDGYSDVIVGAPFYDNGQADEGRAFVFLGSASGLAATAGWTAESDQAGARFGTSVGTAGDVNGDGYSDVIIGAPRYDNGQTDEGRAYVYLGSAAGLAASAVWTKEIDQASANYGISVGTAGDVNGDGRADVIVGAYLFDNGQTDEGAAFVYLGTASGPAATPVWTTEGNQAGAQYGWSVGTAGDVNGDCFADVIVGAPLYDNGQVDEGRAFLYAGNASGVSLSTLWVNESNQASAQYGYSVATAGDINGDGNADILVGAWQYTNGETNEGRAFLYTGGPAGPPTFALWTGESNNAGAYMGWSVGTAGDVNGDGYADVIVAAPFYSSSPTTGGGEIFVYTGSPSGLNDYSYQIRSVANSAYGWSAGTAGDVDGDGYAEYIVGAPWDENGETNEGIVSVYYGHPSFGAPFAWSESNQTSAQSGTSVAFAGDINGDGYGDAIVGAPLYDNGEVNEGKAFVFYGSAAGLSSSLWNYETNQAGSQFGAAVAGAGDVNGDGYSDVLVGAPLYDDLQVDDGRAYLFLGAAAGLSTTPIWITHASGASSSYGGAVAGAGDVNGDGFADFLVGAPTDSNGQSKEGRAYLFLGASASVSTSPGWSAESNQFDARFGFAVAGAGDVNRDGYSDVVVGAPQWTNGESLEGRASLYLGSAAGLAASALWNVESNLIGGQLGSSVASAGDVNGDGFADVVVGTPFNVSRVEVYHGSVTGLPATPNLTISSGGDPGSYFGASVAGAGDVNGDGFADIIVGAKEYNNTVPTGEVYAQVFIYYGSATGINFISSSILGTGLDLDWFGASVAPAGDLNGDGYADVVVGAPLFDSGQTNEGRAQFYFGGAKGISLNPRQRTSDDARAIAQLGLSDSASSYTLAALGRTPFACGRVKLEWEVKPQGTLFNGTGTGISASYASTGATGVSLTAPVSGLSAATPYHWRLRLLYDPATVPFASHSRWVTAPWGGANEAKLRTPAAGTAAGRSDAFSIAKAGLGVTISWTGAASCNPTDADHAIYEGALGNFTSHVPVTCATAPGHSWNFTPQAGNRYFLLVPINPTREGSYGLYGAGIERPVSGAACRPQLVAPCP